jgi:hypothetical protein
MSKYPVREIMANFDIHESDTWVNTNITVDPGESVAITANGSIWAGVWLTGENGPNGWVGWSGDGKPFSEAAPYSLIGEVNNHNFFIGEGYTYTNDTGQAGDLLLSINDDVHDNGSGYFNVDVAEIA